MPVGVGFGIKDPATAKSVAGFSDAIIIGSALVERIDQSGLPADQLADDISGYIGEIRAAIDAS